MPRALAGLCLPLLCVACSNGAPGHALFHLGGEGTLIIGHYTIPPLYRHLGLRWKYVCSGPSRNQGFGVSINAFRGGDPTKNRHAYPVLSAAYVVPGSQGKASVSGQSRIAIHRADYIVLSVCTVMGRTTFYDLRTRCGLNVTAAGETR